MNRFGKAIVSLAILFILVAQIAYAQERDEPLSPPLQPVIRFSHLTADDGLVQNSVEAILQDRQGFMWIGTSAGLSRYDGYRFTTYKHDPDNPNSLSHNWVRDLFEDPQGMIWIATEGGGMNKFDPRTETFTRYLPDPKNPNSLAGDRVFTIFQDNAGNFWFGGTPLTGLNKFNPTTQTYTRYLSHPNDPDAFRGGGVWDMLEDEAGHLWLATDHLLVRYDPRAERFTYYTPPTPEERRLAVLHRDSAGNLWIAGSAGLYQFDVKREVFTHYPAPRGVNDLLEDEVGNFWIASISGLYIFDPRTGQVIQRYHYDATQLDSLNSNNITALYRDRAGVLWVGTGEAGLNVFDPRQTRFAYYRHDPTTPASLAPGPVNAIHAVNESRLWVATGGVLNLLDLATAQMTHYTPETPESTINTVYQDRTGVVWVGMSSLRLYRFDPTTGQFTDYPLKTRLNRPTPPKSVVALYEDGEGALWVAVNHDGLYRLDPSRQNVQFYEGPPSLSALASGTSLATVPRPPITDLYGDQTGHIWVSTLNGFSRFDPRTGLYDQYRAKAGDTGPDSYMETVFEDRNGLIWVASRDGLIRFDPDTEAATYYTEKDGLPTAFVVGILEDRAGNLWLSTKKGLSRFTPSTGAFRNYDIADGLQGNEFSLRAFWQAADGQMFFGGTNGLTAFYPEQISDNPYHPPLVLTDFQLFNKPVQPGQNSPLARPIWATDHLTLNHDQDIFSFEFAALSYATPHKSRYRYKLEGFEEEWNEVASDRRFATYTNLPAGEYIFRVQGTNDSGLWSDQEATLNLTVLPPWWETSWFRVGGLIGLVGLAYGLYRRRVHAIQKQNRLLELQVTVRTQELTERTEDLAHSYALLEQEIVERKRTEEQLQQAKEAAEAANRAKSAFLANMSHELRSPLNAILGFAQIIRRNQELPHEVNENLGIILRSGEHLLTLINQVLDLSKIEVGRISLNESDFDLYDLLNDLEDMFSLKADDKQLQLIFDHSNDLPRYIRTDEVKLRQVLINLLNNALKFTETGGVTLRVKSEEIGSKEYEVRSSKGNDNDSLLPTPYSLLHFEVEDTGPGIAPEEMGRLFEAFTQTETGRQAGEGTGLGLAISRKFIQLMGGDITVKSQIGQGTIFTFNLQCQVIASIENRESPGQLTAGKIPWPPFGRRQGRQNRMITLEPGQPCFRILVVDDQWTNRHLLIQLLNPLGFDLREAENGQQAIEIWEEFEPHLIWMDMRMPVMDGFEATKRIKATTKGQATAIIALTASSFEEERAIVLSAGCDDFVRKPFRETDIFEMMRKHIGLRYVYKTGIAGQDTDIPLPVLLENSKPALDTLPPGLLAQLTEGAELGDMEMIAQVIAEIHHHHPSLAEGLAHLARNFEYDKILVLTQGAAE